MMTTAEAQYTAVSADILILATALPEDQHIPFARNVNLTVASTEDMTAALMAHAALLTQEK